MMRFLLPLAAFIVLVGFLLVGLNLNPRQVPSPLIGKPAPDFQLEQLHESEKTLTVQRKSGQGMALECMGFMVCLLPARASDTG